MNGKHVTNRHHLQLPAADRAEVVPSGAASVPGVRADTHAGGLSSASRARVLETAEHAMKHTHVTHRHRPQLSTTVDPDIALALIALSAATEVPQARLVDRALRLLIATPENRRTIDEFRGPNRPRVAQDNG
jgi:hypothetical protein